MPRRPRQVNRANRRIAAPEAISDEIRARLARARYVGSPQHKSRPADYGFNPPVSPRRDKSLCDDRRVIVKKEAVKLFRSGIRLGMISRPTSGLPKFVWAVDDAGEAYEAILGGDGANYHGYRLYRDAPNRDMVIAEWRKRNQ